jgi:hypothetical protein
MPKLIADGREYPLSDELWAALQKAARPFEMPEDVLRRHLGMKDEPPVTMPTGDDEEGGQDLVKVRGRQPRERTATRKAKKRTTKRTRVPSSLLLPEEEYELPILKALEVGGGRRPTREVIEEVGRQLNGRLTETDREPMRDGGPARWENRVQFARLRLVKAGLLKEGSPRGVWELSPAGEKRLEEVGA